MNEDGAGFGLKMVRWRGWTRRPHKTNSPRMDYVPSKRLLIKRSRHVWRGNNPIFHREEGHEVLAGSLARIEERMGKLEAVFPKEKARAVQLVSHLEKTPVP